MSGEFESFYSGCPEIAEAETRNILNLNNPNFPKGQYLLLENYCIDKKCDCRKVMINFIKENKIFATICYGWEDLKYYEKFIGDKELAKYMFGASLELGGQQSEYAKYFLAFFKDVILKDKFYVDRLKKHYKLFKGIK